MIRITSASPSKLQGGGRRRTVGKSGTIITGAEPWNIVISPNGRRVFVANSGQDTITVIDATRQRQAQAARRRRSARRLIGYVELRGSACSPDAQPPLPAARPGGDEEQQAAVRDELLLVPAARRRQVDDKGTAGRRLPAQHQHEARSRIRSYRPSARITLLPRDTGFTVDANGDGVPDPTSAFPNQLQSIVIRGNQAYLPNIAASPTARCASTSTRRRS